MDFLDLCKVHGLRRGNFEKKPWVAGLKRMLRFWYEECLVSDTNVSMLAARLLFFFCRLFGRAFLVLPGFPDFPKNHYYESNHDKVSDNLVQGYCRGLKVSLCAY